MSKKTGSTKTHIRVRARKSRHAFVISLVLALLTAGGALAQWSAVVWVGQKPTKNKGIVTTQSFSPGSPSKEYIYAGGKLVATEEPQGQGCSYSLSSTNASFTPSGGSSTVSVNTTPGCSWTALSNDPTWIIVTSGSSGTGSGIVGYSVLANSTGSNRSGTMAIAQQTFYVTQSGSPCAYSISPTNKTFTAAAGSDFVTVTADPGCQWTAVSSDTTWLHITSGSSGTGNGSVNYSVDANGSVQRYGTITIADRVLTVTQLGTGGGCSYSTYPTDASFPNGAATSGTVLLTTQPGCTWNAISYSYWLHVTSGSPGNGTGTVAYSVDANNGTKSRTGTMTIADKIFHVTQGFGAGGGGGGGTGTGLTGEYFNFSTQPPDQRLCGTLAVSRLDQQVDFDWGTSSPAGGVGADNFHVRWTGQVEAPETGNYAFSVRTDDGVKLWVNNQLLIDKWFNQFGNTWTNIIQLSAGQKYDIRMEMYEWDGGAEAHLWWQRPAATAREIVPTSRLYPYNPPAQPLYEGWLDAVDCTTIRGWAFNRRQLNTAINVSIYADNNPTPLATVTANQARPDLASFCCDNGQHGYSYAVPQSLKDGQPHSVTVQYTGTNIALSGTPLTLTCSGGATAPAPPSNLSALAVSPFQIDLVWQDNSNNENGFVIQRNIDGGSYGDFATINSPNVTTYSDLGLVSGHTYCYKVLAFNNVGRSTEPTPACATIQGSSSGPPLPPSSLTATFVSMPIRKVDLAWTDNSNNENGFQVLRRQRKTTTTIWSPYYSLNRLPQNTTSYSDTSALSNGYTYGYVVLTWNDYGTSVYSNEAQVQIPLGQAPTCSSVSAFSGTGGSGSYGYSEGAGGAAKWRSPSAGATGIDPVSGLNVMFVADTDNHVIRMLYLEGPAAGSTVLIAGSGVAGYSEGDGDPYQARFNYPQGIAAIMNQSGVVQSLLVADTDNQVIRQLLPPLGRNRWRVTHFSGTWGKSGYADDVALDSQFNSPHGIAVGLDGFIYVADTFNHAVRMLNSEGYSATWYVAQSTFQPIGITFNQISGGMYVSDQGNHRISSLTEGTFVTLAGSGSPGYADGTGTAAVFNTPYHMIWSDSESGGWLYIADLNNNRLRVFDFKTNAVTTWAGSGTLGYINSTCLGSQFNLPSGIALGVTNELYVIEKGNNAIRKVQ